MDHSRWRIALAREIVKPFASLPGVRMIVLGGSPARGISDEFSDLDMVFYWDEIDFDLLRDPSDLHPSAERRAVMGSREAGFLLESYYLFGTLKADLAHMPLGTWEEWAADVLERHVDDPEKTGSFEGFLASIPLHGPDLVADWKNRLSVYPDEVAEKIVRANCRFFVKDCLLHQGMGRGERLFLADGTGRMLRQVLMIVAALNRRYYSAEDPRWIEARFATMPLKPRDMWPRMCRVLRLDGPSCLDELESLIEETLDLVAEHMPAIDVAGLRSRREALRVTASRIGG